MGLVQHLGDDRPEQGVAEKLHALVVGFAGAAMRQGKRGKRRIAKVIRQFHCLLGWSDIARHGHALAEVDQEIDVV
ncbi:hypothetical protein, partial [Dyella sp.]|uniref:hypothetical protein n=1 Tax=Dyella sp. TaxID=1869338 RepID=UPI002B46E355